MKKTFLLLFAALALALIVSCSTTQASDVPPVVREIDVNMYTAKEYNADQVYKMLERYVKDAFGEEKKIAVIKDVDAKTITVSGYEIGANVGPLAQDGCIVVDLKFEAKDGKAIFSVIFIESYTYVKFGPVQKKSMQGITSLGMKELEWQSTYIADAFHSSLSSYAYYVDNNVI